MAAFASRVFRTVLFNVEGRVAKIVLNRPARGNGINFEMPEELAACVEMANLDPSVHVITLSGAGKGFCGGYDLVMSAEGQADDGAGARFPEGSPQHPDVVAANHNPQETWDPVVDYQMMSRNVRGFMSLYNSEKPVLVKVHGFCVAGGTDMALCSDLVIIAEDARIGYPPARVWGVPTTAMWAQRIGMQRAKRLMFTGDLISGRTAVEWGLALQCAPAAQLDAVFDDLVQRIAKVPVNQLVMQKMALHATAPASLSAAQQLSVLLDGVARAAHQGGYAFQRDAIMNGFKQAVHTRDAPFGDHKSKL